MASEKTPQAHRDSTNTPALEWDAVPQTFLQKFKATLMVPLIVFVALAAFGQVLEVSTNQYVQLVLLYMCANMIFAVSLNLVNGFTGQFSIGHAGFMAVGAYTSAYLSTAFKPPNCMVTFEASRMTLAAAAIASPEIRKFACSQNAFWAEDHEQDQRERVNNHAKINARQVGERTKNELRQERHDNGCEDRAGDRTHSAQNNHDDRVDRFRETERRRRQELR